MTKRVCLGSLLRRAWPPAGTCQFDSFFGFKTTFQFLCCNTEILMKCKCLSTQNCEILQMISNVTISRRSTKLIETLAAIFGPAGEMPVVTSKLRHFVCMCMCHFPFLYYAEMDSGRVLRLWIFSLKLSLTKSLTNRECDFNASICQQQLSILRSCGML